MKISDLIAKRAELFTTLEDITKAAELQKRFALNADELKRSDEIEAEIKGIDESIERLKRQQEIAVRGLALTPAQAEPTKPNPTAENRGSGIPAEAKKNEEVFATFGEQLRAIAKVGNPGTDVDTRQKLTNMLEEVNKRSITGANTQVDTEGGFLITPAISAQIEKRAFEVGKLVSQVKKLPMPPGANRLITRALKDDDRATGKRLGGIRGYWVNEGDTATPTKPAFRTIEINLKKILAFFYATDEELEDAPLLESIALPGFSDEIAFMMDDVILRGDGAMQPLGIYNSDSLVTITKEAGQATNTIVYQNVLKMYAQLAGENGVWYANKNTLPQLAQMSLAVGNAGAPVWMPAGGASGKPYNTLMGLPLQFIEQAETVGTVGDLNLLDLSQYAIADKGGLRSDSSMHVRFLYGENVFRVQYRVGGQPLWDKAVSPYKGAGKFSPFIVLQSRP